MSSRIRSKLFTRAFSKALSATVVLSLVIVRATGTIKDVWGVVIVLGALAYALNLIDWKRWLVPIVAAIAQVAFLFMHAAFSFLITFMADSGGSGYDFMDIEDWLVSWGILAVSLLATTSEIGRRFTSLRRG